MDNLDRKVCPHCAERIQSAAKKCPFCMTQLVKPKWYKNPQNLYFLPMAIVFPYIFFTTSNANNRPTLLFANYAQKVNILSTEMRFENTLRYHTDGTKRPARTVTVLGTVRNDSDVTWSQPHYEAQFYDKAGKLIDVQTEGSMHVALAPHQTQAFRIQTTAHSPFANYASVKVIVRTAEDADKYLR
ncbi:MAG: FxLYD domain-containing protein [Armatimonadetes bacterium]|nr:FxLYD domain-containing protein [Armatimonadota bacterium]